MICACVLHGKLAPSALLAINPSECCSSTNFPEADLWTPMTFQHARHVESSA